MHTVKSQGGFVRQSNGLWYSVDDNFAREKVGQNLRNLLYTKYKSSERAKHLRRQNSNRNGSKNRAMAGPSQVPEVGLASQEDGHNETRAELDLGWTAQEDPSSSQPLVYNTNTFTGTMFFSNREMPVASLPMEGVPHNHIEAQILDASIRKGQPVKQSSPRYVDCMFCSLEAQQSCLCNSTAIKPPASGGKPQLSWEWFEESFATQKGFATMNSKVQGQCDVLDDIFDTDELRTVLGEDGETWDTIECNTLA